MSSLNGLAVPRLLKTMSTKHWLNSLMTMAKESATCNCYTEQVIMDILHLHSMTNAMIRAQPLQWSKLSLVIFAADSPRKVGETHRPKDVVYGRKTWMHSSSCCVVQNLMCCLINGKSLRIRRKRQSKEMPNGDRHLDTVTIFASAQSVKMKKILCRNQIRAMHALVHQRLRVY